MSASREVHPSVSKSPIPLEARDLATVCVLCSHNCGIRVDVAGGRIVAIRPDERNPITEGYICNKAVTCDKYAHHDQRVQHPLRKRPDGSFETISWDTAISEIAAKLSKIRNEHSPRSIALVGIGGQANHMDAAYGGPFLRAVGSRRFFNAYAQEKHQHHLVDHWMFDAAPSLFFHPDMENATYLLVMGTNPRISNRGHNPTETFKHLAKKESCKVVAVDPRETETTRGADQHLRVNPGSDAYLLLGVAASLVQNELYDAEFVASATAGFNEVRDVLSRVDRREMAARAGIELDSLDRVAEEMAKAEHAAIMFDLGVEQLPFSTLVSYLIRLNLALTGNLGEGGNFFLGGFVPPQLSSSRFEEPERALASGIQSIRALGNFAMFSPTLVPEEILFDHAERIRGVIVEGSNPLLSYSDTGAWREAIDRLDLLVVIDPAFTETARLADYVLPVPVGYEKWEIALFPKRYPQVDVQLRPPVIPAPPDTLPEGEIYARLAEAMGICDPLPDDIAAIGKPETPEARSAFMATAMSKLGDVVAKGIDAESQLVFWAYRGIGHHFPSPSVVAIWAMCLQNAMARKDDVVRALGEAWREKDPFAITEEMFSRILAHPEGVEVARVETGNNLERNIGFADKKVRLAPARMLEEMERAMATPLAPDPEYPFVLASGLRTRWTANTIQRDPAWRKGAGPHCELSLHPDDAAKLGIAKGDVVRVETKRGAIEMPAALDGKLKPGHVWMPNGFGMQVSKSIDAEPDVFGAPMNEITDAADRDPISGCPHHRYVPVKLSKVAAMA